MTDLQQLDLMSWRPKGATIVLERDLDRLSRQMRKVYDVLKDGREYSLEALGRLAQCPPASASARFRDLRAMGFPVQRRYVARGLFLYSLKS